MAAVQFWTDGYLGTHMAESCPLCRGNMWPLKKPDPKLECNWCYGMGGGLAIPSGCPYVIIPVLTFYQVMVNILGFSRTDFKTLGRIHSDDLLKRLSIGESKIDDLPDIYAGAQLLVDLRDLGQFATEVERDVVWA